MKIQSFLCTLFTLPNLLNGKVIETHRFDEILNHIEYVPSEKTLVVCDIDNTLLEGAHYLGSVAWAENFIAGLVKKGISQAKAADIEDSIWQILQPRIPVKTVDPCTSEVLQEIQTKPILVLGLTARSPAESDYTFEQLRSLNITFDQQKLVPQCKEHLPYPSAALYDRGILYATPFNKKSEVLFDFLNRHALKPECIIYLDDKLHHVEDIDAFCASQGITCIGIRFSGADEQFKQFDPDLARIQWEAFPRLISNEEALSLFNAQTK